MASVLLKMEWKKKGGGGGGGGGSSSKRKREDAPKKHKSSEFCQRRSLSIGVVTKLDFGDVRSLVNDPDAQVIMRPLGQRVETFSSQQIVYLESTVEEDVIGGLQNEIAELKDMLASVTKSTKDLEERVDARTRSLEERANMAELFMHQGMSTALRAFCDLILSAFFKVCGKEDVGFAERATWLTRRGADGAKAFVIQEKVTLLLFGVEKTVEKREF